MMATHRMARRALAVAVLCVALLGASLARADESAPPGRTPSVFNRYLAAPTFAVAFAVIVVVLVQAARASAADPRQPPAVAALSAIDRALAAARGREVLHSTRWRARLQRDAAGPRGAPVSR